MKALRICLALFLALLCLCSCGKQNSAESTAGQATVPAASSLAETSVPETASLPAETVSAQEHETTPAAAPEASREGSASRHAMTINEMISLAPCIFTAKYESGPDVSGRYDFTVLACFRGDLTGTQSVNCFDFTPDKNAEYLFFAERFANVMNDTVFLVIDDYVRETGSGLQSLSITDLKDRTYGGLLAELPALVQAFPSANEGGVISDYIHSNDIRVIAEEADAVILATVEAIRKTLDDRVWCRLTDITCLKGVTVSSESIVVVPLGSVQEGASYYFCLTDVGDNIGFIIAAPGSIYLPESEEGQYLSSLK